MGVSHRAVCRSVKWAVIGTCAALAGPAWAQSAASTQGAADPRAASKAPIHPIRPGPSYGQVPQSSTPTQGYRQAPTSYHQPSFPQPRRAATGYTPRQQPHAYILAPPVLPYREGVEPPQGYVLSAQRNGGLMTGGGLTWGAAYAGGLVYALSKGFDNGTGWLAAPIVGPWGAIGGRDFRCQSSQSVTQKEIDSCVDGALDEVTSITLLAMLGLVQAVGATLFFVGVGDKHQEWVRTDLAGVQLKADVGSVGDSAQGLKLAGQF